MKSTSVFLALAFLATVALPSAHAEPVATKTQPGKTGGINLSWGDCGRAGQGNLDFACATDTTTRRIVASFVAPAGLAGYLGLFAQLTVSTAEALPDFWKHGPEGCRGKTALVSDFDFTRDSSCVDFFAGGAFGGHGVTIGAGGANRAVIMVQCAVPLESRGPLTEGKEYYGFALRFVAPKSAAGDSCKGCDVPACITLDRIQLFQPPDAKFDPILTTPVGRAHVTWQGGPTPCPGAASTPKGWGQVKNIHH